MQYKIAFCDKEGKEYGVLDKVDENTTLSNIRLQGAKNLKFFPTRYSFIWKDTPISLRQETILKVNKYAEGKYGKDQTLKILIAVNSLNSEGKHGQSSGVSTNHEQTHSTTSNEKVNTVNMHVKLCKLKTFCDNELADPSISTLEKERRYFWNNLSAKVDSHQVYKDWSLQARTGIKVCSFSATRYNITHVLLVTLVCKNKYRAPSRCIQDPTFRHFSLVSSSGVI